VTASKLAVLAGAIIAAPAIAQTTVDAPPGTTTTVQSQPQQAPPPPSTTVEVQQAPQPAPPPPGTQVVVNPQPAPAPAAPAPSRVNRYDTTDVVESHPHRPAMVTIATDALYGGIAGLAVGAGVALIANDSNHWPRDLMVGAGAGLLIGGAIGAVEAVSDASDHTTTTRRAEADIRDSGGRAPSGFSLSYGSRF